MPERELDLTLSGRIPHHWALKGLLVGLSLLGQHRLMERVLAGWQWEFRVGDGPWLPGGALLP